MMWRDGTNDHNTLTSCMTEDEYGLRSLPEAGTVVDVGGYLGGVGIGYAVDHRDARVWIVEPLAANCDLIRKNIDMNELGARVTLIEAAADEPGAKRTRVLWDFGDDESAHHHRFVGNSTIATHSERHQSQDVACIDLPALVRLAGGHIDLLKIDCEGGEYALFAKGAADVGIIVGEQHEGFARLADLLSGTHDVFNDGDEHFGPFHATPRAA